MADELALVAPPDPAWQLSSPASQAPSRISRDTMLDELRAELRRRRDLYPGLIAKGQLTREQADREVALFVAIGEELSAGEPVEGRFGWFEKIHGLRREINLRRNVYPKRVAKGQLTHEDAQHHLEVLEAVHWLYWIEGFASDDARLLAPRPERAAFSDGMLGDWNHASAIVERSAGRTAFFEEREAWVRAQRQPAAA